MRVRILKLYGFRGFVVIADIPHEFALEVLPECQDHQTTYITLNLYEERLSAITRISDSRNSCTTIFVYKATKVSEGQFVSTPRRRRVL